METSFSFFRAIPEHPACHQHQRLSAKVIGLAGVAGTPGGQHLPARFAGVDGGSCLLVLPESGFGACAVRDAAWHTRAGR